MKHNNEINKIYPTVAVKIIMETHNDYDILTFVTPNKSMFFNINDHLNNKNIVLLIIESMCIGIVLPEHIARRFSYITNAIKYEEYTNPTENGMKIVKIGSEWDTRKWSYSKIKKFYNVLEYIEMYDTDKIKEKIYNYELDFETRTNIDIYFLESLLWNSNLELD